MNTKGFTLMEALVVIVIIGVLAILFLPSMQDPIEKGRAKNAEFNLLAIHSAQKRYLLSERAYYLANQSIALQNRVDAINGNLSIKIDDQYFDYDIAAEGTSGYRARAVRKDGKCKNQQMSLTADNSTVNKQGCAAW